MTNVDRRRFLQGALTSAGLVGAGAAGLACAPHASLASAEHTLRGLWDAVVPGTHNGVVEDWLSEGVPAPGANDAGVHEWIAEMGGELPGELGYLTDWFLRAWAADLDLWADWFHLPVGDGPSFGSLPLGPTFDERGRQYKILLMTTLFDSVIDLKYFGGVTIAKVAFYGDFWAERSGGERVASNYIGFPGPLDSVTDFTYNQSFGTPDSHMVPSPNGLTVTP